MDVKVYIKKINNDQHLICQKDISEYAKNYAKECISKNSDMTSSSIEFAYEQQGKPYIKDSEIYFNISHSGEYVAVAVSDHQVGIDIQKIKPVKDNVIRRLFDEETAFDIIGANDKEEKFTKCFCMLESALKLKGTGFYGYDNKDYDRLMKECKISVQRVDDYFLAYAEYDFVMF